MPSFTHVQLVAGASAVAVGTAGLVTLIAVPEHDLARSLSMIGLFFAGLATHHILCAGRLDGFQDRLGRVEGVTAKVCQTEKAVLDVLDERTRHLN